MSKTIMQFAHGVLTMGETQLTKPTVERNPSGDALPANPFAESGVQDEANEEGKPSDPEPGSNEKDTASSGPAAESKEAPAADAKQEAAAPKATAAKATASKETK